jgi:MOSC domain-containing protein YiiM
VWPPFDNSENGAIHRKANDQSKWYFSGDSAKGGGWMQIFSVNIGQEQPIRNGKPSGKTGIFKLPCLEPVIITAMGLQGDAIVDTENHGGLDQAVYMFTLPDYAWWSAHIGRTLGPGIFGDNLTISDLESATLNIGDRFQVGEVLLEVTSPRIPCVTIAARMEDPHFVKKFRRAEKPGVYCRVIQTGYIKANDPVELISYQGLAVGVLELFRTFYQKQLTEDELRRFLAVPIHTKSRPRYEEMLANLLGQATQLGGPSNNALY